MRKAEVLLIQETKTEPSLKFIGTVSAAVHPSDLQTYYPLTNVSVEQPVIIPSLGQAFPINVELW